MDLPFEVDDDTKPGQRGSHHVLIVDDETVVLDVFAGLLAREKDLTLATASAAEGALELLRQRHFDLLITDKNLPGMGGVELIAKARKLRPAIEAIVITGYASAESVIAAFAAGASDYLRKPFDDLKTVRTKVRAALERRVSRHLADEQSKRLAREATELLARGTVVPEPVWQALERELGLYEAAMRAAASGRVRVIGVPDVLPRLKEETGDAQLAEFDDPTLGDADVVVIDTTFPGWRRVADGLGGQRAAVVLLAHADADVGDLLDALTLHQELVGFGASREIAVDAAAAKVRELLIRRNLERTQAALVRALESFRAALDKR